MMPAGWKRQGFYCQFITLNYNYETNNLTVMLLLVFLSVSGQKKINNMISREHENIAGTKISVIPPAGFIKAVDFLGLQLLQNEASIMINDIPGPYSEVSKGLAKEAFLSQGVVVRLME